MDKYLTVEIDSEIYRKINGQWVDSKFLVPPREILELIIHKLFNLDRLSQYPTEELREQLLYCKNEKLFPEAIAFADELQSRYETGVNGIVNIPGLRWILPVSTSLYRMMGNPHRAIEIYNNAITKFGEGVTSGALYVSIAAAYCDLEDYETALKFCNKAWALGDRSLELQAVYKRINEHRN